MPSGQGELRRVDWFIRLLSLPKEKLQAEDMREGYYHS